MAEGSWKSLNRLVLLMLLVPFSGIFAQECDPRCSTHNCDGDGVCICEFPAESSALDGERLFLGGEFCDVPRTMCDSTNAFWCGNGVCNEIVQGENYTCTCREGYAGVHCEVEGVPCGDMFCYHNAECIQADVPCDCSADWKGSQDCSLPTLTSTTKNNTNSEAIRVHDHDSHKWYFPFSAVVVVIVVALTGILGAKLLKSRAAASDFDKLQQVQMRGFSDDEEDEETFTRAPLSKAELAS